MQYQVSEIYATVQGEGVNTGVPMVILRMQGCNLRCKFCDSKYSWREADGMDLSTTEVIEKVQEGAQGAKWIMLTGGEPALQDLDGLIYGLHKAGFEVALETNGTMDITGYPDWICVSPKLRVEGGQAVLSQNLLRASELKFVVSVPEDMIIIDDFLVAHQHTILKGSTQVCLQPESADPESTKLCFRECLKRGWRLSIQVHKYIGIR